MAEKQIKQVFRRPREDGRLPDPDPMAEFSARYHLEAERRRLRLSCKYGVGYWDTLDEQTDNDLQRQDGGFPFFSDEEY